MNSFKLSPKSTAGPRRTRRINLSWQLLREEAGQGLVEFAIVLPILLMLTLGTILLTLSYIQKARMNGLAFMSARVAAVRRSDFDASDFTLKKYAELSQQTWLSEVTASTPATDPDAVAVGLRKPGERLDVLANLISGQSSQPLDLMVEMQLPREYSGSGSLRAATFTQVDYQFSNAKMLASLGALSILPIYTDVLVDKSSDKNLGLNPSEGKLKQFYSEVGWADAFRDNDEKAAGSFATMQSIYANFKLIGTTGWALQAFLDLLTGFGGELLKGLGTGGEVAAALFEKQAHSSAILLEENARSSFSGGGL